MLRQKARSIFIYVIFAVIIIVFIFYFGWGGVRKKLYRGKLDKKTIQKLGIKKTAYENLIKNTLLLETADSINWEVPKVELEKAINQTPAFLPFKATENSTLKDTSRH